MGTPDHRLDLDLGVAGRSARREHERRRLGRQAHNRQGHPVLRLLQWAADETPQHERAWARGAQGEEKVADTLAKCLNDDVVVLHDRKIPRTRANIDHIAVAPSGVWVIDTKRYSGRVAVARPLLGKETLRIAGRDKSALVDSLARQVDLVDAAIESSAPVRGAFCFVDADLPLLRTLTIRDIALLYPASLARRINKPGPLSAVDVDTTAQRLARRFPAA